MSRSAYGAAALVAVQDIDDEPERFAQFYGQYHPRVRRYAGACFGYTHADEIAQETMARAYDAFGRLDVSRDPWPWLAVVARNIGRNLVRQLGRCQLIDLESFDEVVDGGWSDPVRTAETQEVQNLIAEALSALPVGQRRVMLLRLVEGLGFSTIAEMLGSSENAVRQQLFKGRKAFASRFEALGGRLEAALPIGAVLGLGRRLVRRLTGASRTTVPLAATGLTAMAGALALGIGLTYLGLAPGGAQATGRDSQPAVKAAAVSTTEAVGASSVTTRPPVAPQVAAPVPNTLEVRQGPASAQARLGKSIFDRGEYLTVTARVDTPVGHLEVKYRTERKPGLSPACTTGLVTCS